MKLNVLNNLRFHRCQGLKAPANAVLPQANSFSEIQINILICASQFENAASNCLSGLLNSLHLFADSCASCFISACCLVDVGFNFIYQCLEVFVFLHLKSSPKKVQQTVIAGPVPAGQPEHNGLPAFCQKPIYTVQQLFFKVFMRKTAIFTDYE